MEAYEDTLEDIEKTWGIVPDFMKVLPKELLVQDWPSWKKDSLGEIDLERARYLLSADEILEEMLSEKQGNVVLTPTESKYSFSSPNFFQIRNNKIVANPQPLKPEWKKRDEVGTIVRPDDIIKEYPGHG